MAKFTDEYFKANEIKDSISTNDYFNKVEIEGVTLCIDAIDERNEFKIDIYEEKLRKLDHLPNDKKIVDGCVKLLKKFVETESPKQFYLLGSVDKEIYNDIIESSLKLFKKSYNVVDERQDETIHEDKENKTEMIRDGNPVGKIIFTKAEVKEVGDYEEVKLDKKMQTVKPYEDVKDIKVNKEFTKPDSIKESEMKLEEKKSEGTGVPAHQKQVNSKHEKQGKMPKSEATGKAKVDFRQDLQTKIDKEAEKMDSHPEDVKRIMKSVNNAVWSSIQRLIDAINKQNNKTGTLKG